MAVYKDTNGTWHVRFTDRDIKGKPHEIHKRGFSTKGEAKSWEESYRTVKAGSVRMTFAKFIDEVYCPQMEPRVKPGTWATKISMIDKYIKPFFPKALNEIEPADLMKWQNHMLTMKNPKTGKPFAKSYLQSINNQLTAILSYAVRYYKLPSNPAHIVGNVGSEDDIHIVYWNLEQYKRFAEVMMEEPLYYYIFEVLFWSGIREGECLALQLQDIDLVKKNLIVNKTFYRLKGKDIVGTPKTKQSYRTVALPDNLVEELGDYINMMYKPNPTDRLFPVTKSALTRRFKQGAKMAGLPECHVHSLRHAAASLLLELGYSIPAIAARLGHSPVNVGITYKYAHSSPATQEDIANTLDRLSREDQKDVCEEQG